MTDSSYLPGQPLLLGLDIGTSSTKASVFTASGKEIASSTREYELLLPKSGYVEQHPDTWWNAARETCADVVSKVEATDIVGVGVAGQSWACVLLDEHGRVLCNSPLWMDTRAARICEDVREHIGEDRLFATAGNPFSPSYTTPKLLWFAQERPELLDKTTTVLQSNSFIVYRLTGQATQDLSMTYGLQFANIRDGSYDQDVADALGINLELFPRCVPCDQVVGKVTAKAAVLTGLKEGTPVVAGGLDAACGALGAGVYRPTQCQEQGGQAGGISVATDELIVDKRLICSPHVVPGLWLLQGGTSAGGAALRWAAKQIGVPDSSFSAIDRAVSLEPPLAGGLWFLPYLAGERTPLWDPDAKGVMYGLTLSSTRPQMLRAVMEGVAFALNDNIRAMKDAGAHFGDVYSIGGASKSELWTQIKCDVTGLRISVPMTDSATTLGAAILAGVGVGVYNDFEQAVCRTQSIGRVQNPNTGLHTIYDRAFSIYQRLYCALAPIMKETSALMSDQERKD